MFYLKKCYDPPSGSVSVGAARTQQGVDEMVIILPGNNPSFSTEIISNPGLKKLSSVKQSETRVREKVMSWSNYYLVNGLILLLQINRL